MLKNITSLFAGVLVVGMSMTGCIIVTDGGDTEADETTTSDTDATDSAGDGDGDATAGDGDGDATAGDGDGDATDTDPATDSAGDGDGDATDSAGDGDGDETDTDTAPPPAQCGWDPDNAYYECGFEGEDPGGTFPIGCPDGLVEGDPCEVTGLPGEGCCDANGDNWYCGDNEGEQIVVFNGCGG